MVSLKNKLFIIAFLPLIFLAVDLGSTAVGLSLGGRESDSPSFPPLLSIDAATKLSPWFLTFITAQAAAAPFLAVVAKRAEIKTSYISVFLSVVAARYVLVHLVAGLTNCFLIIQWLMT